MTGLNTLGNDISEHRNEAGNGCFRLAETVGDAFIRNLRSKLKDLLTVLNGKVNLPQPMPIRRALADPVWELNCISHTILDREGHSVNVERTASYQPYIIFYTALPSA